MAMRHQARCGDDGVPMQLLCIVEALRRGIGMNAFLPAPRRAFED